MHKYVWMDWLLPRDETWHGGQTSEWSGLSEVQSWRDDIDSISSSRIGRIGVLVGEEEGKIEWHGLVAQFQAELLVLGMPERQYRVVKI